MAVIKRSTATSTVLTPIPSNYRTVSSIFRRSESSWIGSEEERRDALPQQTNEGSDIVVVQMGSRNIRIGFSNSVFPKSVLNVIARKQKSGVAEKSRFPFLDDSEGVDDVRGKQSKHERDDICGFNRNAVPTVISRHDDALGIDWISAEEDVVVGEEALLIRGNGYKLGFPIHHRHFNVEMYASVRGVVDDLEDMLRKMCEQHLDISASRIREYCLAIVVPDGCYQKELRGWIEAGFGCGFRSVLMIVESIAATFGAGLSSACVVDVGAEQTSVALVDDGCILSRTSLDYGGDHTLRLLDRLLRRNEFPYKEMDLTNYQDWRHLENLKKEICRFGVEGVQTGTLYVRHPEKDTLQYQFEYGSEIGLVGMSLFNPQWLGLRQQTWKDELKEDIDEILHEKGSGWQSKKSMELDEGQEDDEDEVLSGQYPSESDPRSAMDVLLECVWNGCDDKIEGIRGLLEHGIEHARMGDDMTCRWNGCGQRFTNRMSFECHLMRHVLLRENGSDAMFGEGETNEEGSEWMGVDEAIMDAIGRVEEDVERVGKWLGSILVVGGGWMFPGFVEYLSERLKERRQDDRVGILTGMKGIDARIVTWKGGCVGARLEGNREGWISEKEWRRVGFRAVVDKYPQMFSVGEKKNEASGNICG